MIDVFYTPGKGIYLEDGYNPKDMIRELEQTGQITVEFKGFQGPKEASYPTGIREMRQAGKLVADEITRKVSRYLGDASVAAGPVKQISTEMYANGTIGKSYMVFQILPTLV